jgi:tetratricopeptide (TPR) repeat protein
MTTMEPQHYSRSASAAGTSRKRAKAASSIQNGAASGQNGHSDPLQARRALDRQLNATLEHAHNQYSAGEYQAALSTCESIYEQDATRTDALLLLGAVHYQLRQFNECVFYNQQVSKALSCLQQRRPLSSPLQCGAVLAQSSTRRCRLCSLAFA